jgi:hypothetical protein
MKYTKRRKHGVGLNGRTVHGYWGDNSRSVSGAVGW